MGTTQGRQGAERGPAPLGELIRNIGVRQQLADIASNAALTR